MPRLRLVPQKCIQVKLYTDGILTKIKYLRISRSLVIPTDKRRVLHFGKVRNIAQGKFCLAVLADDADKLYLGD